MGFLNIDKIRVLMSRKGYGNQALSDASGVALGTLNDMLRNVNSSPKIGNIIAIAKALDCSVDYLLLDPPQGSTIPLHPAVRELAAIIDDLNDQGIDRLMQNARDIAAIGYYKKGHSAVSGEELA